MDASRRGWWAVAVLAASVGAGGCSVHELSSKASHHVVMFDYDGKPVDPTDPIAPWNLLEVADYDRLTQEQFREHVDAIGEHILASEREGDTRGVLIFIHGGLNTQSASVERVEDLYRDIIGAGRYPLFVNWRSELTNSYRDHLFYVRQGADVHEGDTLEKAFGYLTSPIVFAIDVVRSVVRLPLTISAQVTGTFEWMKATSSRYREAADHTFALLQNGEDYNVQSSESRLCDGASEPESIDPSWWEFPRWVLLWGPKIVAIAAIDTAGTGSWSIMKRRVEQLFQRDKEILERDRGEKVGYLLQVMKMLHDVQEELGGDLPITLVGHSMGTLVSNRLLDHGLAYDPNDDGAVFVPDFDKVVYLAAACSVQDYEDSVFPYLRHRPEARVFHVVLHPDNELREVVVGGLAPRGSLLTWVDDFLANPVTLLQRTAGRYDNLIPSIANTPADLRQRVYVRVLPEDRGEEPRVPQRHGDFSEPLADFCFWDEESWWPGWSEETDDARTAGSP